MRRFSRKREAERPARRQLVERVLARDRHQCLGKSLVWHVGCEGPLDVHELVPRSRWPGGYLIDENCIAICRAHHDWCHGHPNEAQALGLLMPAP